MSSSNEPAILDGGVTFGSGRTLRKPNDSFQNIHNIHNIHNTDGVDRPLLLWLKELVPRGFGCGFVGRNGFESSSSFEAGACRKNLDCACRSAADAEHTRRRIIRFPPWLFITDMLFYTNLMLQILFFLLSAQKSVI